MRKTKYVIAMALVAIMTFGQAFGAVIKTGAKSVVPDDRNYYVDYSLSTDDVSQACCYKDLVRALSDAVSGTENSPMRIWIAPGVYWIDDVESRMPVRSGDDSCSVRLDCDWVQLIGISGNPEDVVIASNRGSGQGCGADYTALLVSGDNFSAHGVTFGNYCNVDLNYVENAELSRQKSSIRTVNAGISRCTGDRCLIRNCCFTGRNGMLAFGGGHRTLFDSCSFECADNSIAADCVYLGCDFNLSGCQPLGKSKAQGTVFIDCDFNTADYQIQYLASEAAPISLVDCRFDGGSRRVEWARFPDRHTKCYQSGISFGGKPYTLSDDYGMGVDMEGLPLMDAYCVQLAADNTYNVYNLLSGHDGWDPLGQKPQIDMLEQSLGRKFSDIPVIMLIEPSELLMESGGADARFTAKVSGFDGGLIDADFIGWSSSSPGLSIEAVSADGLIANVKDLLEENDNNNVIISAVSGFGLEASSIVSVAKTLLEAPELTSYPEIVQKGKKHFRLRYYLEANKSDDLSEVSWYRCYDSNGKERVLVKRLSGPDPDKFKYDAVKDDSGCYIMVEVRPRIPGSEYGAPAVEITDSQVARIRK